MKRSQELLGLSVIGIEDGKDIGRVVDFIICPTEGAVKYLVLDDGIKYLGIKFLPFCQVECVGEHAVTVLNTSSVVSVAELTDLRELIEKNVQLKGVRAVTRKGMLVGIVTEFFVDCQPDGRITGCQITPAALTAKPQVILSEQIITFGKDILVVNDEVKAVPGGFKAMKEPGGESGASGSEKAVVSQAPSEAARMFEERQRKYLMGRKSSRKIAADNGEIIADDGQLITEEVIDRAKKRGKFTELSMNTKA